MGKRNIEFYSLHILSGNLLLCKYVEVSHNLHSICKFNEGYPWVFGVGDNKFAVNLLVKFCLFYIYAGDFVEPLHHCYNLCAVALPELLCQKGAHIFALLLLHIFGAGALVQKDCGNGICHKTNLI